MSIKLRNRKAAESFLGQFVEDLTVQPKLISNVLESEARPRRCSRHLSACWLPANADELSPLTNTPSCFALRLVR